MRAVFIVLDTVRRDYLRAYGNDWVHTPTVDRLARDGITFDNHWVGSLPCMPARREFMTGRYNFLYRGWGPIEPYDDTLPKLLRDQKVFSHLLTDHDHYFELGGENYHTAFTTWDFHRGTEHDPWVSLVDAIAIPEVYRERFGLQQNFKNRLRQVEEHEFSGPRTADAAVRWLDDNKAADNWFLQVEIFDPHEPFYCAPKYREMYNDTWKGPHYDWPDYSVVKDSPEAVEHIRKCYAGLLTQTDFWIGKIIDKLKAIGQYDDTLIIFTTDHGTMLAEHGYWMKGFMPLYNEIARIPLIVKLPGNRHANARVGAFTQTIDVMPTFVEHFRAAIPPHLHGTSLLPLTEGKPGRPDGILGYFGHATNTTDGKFVYMRNPINADGGPLHAYTAMPVGGLNRYYPREDFPRWEMGRYFGHTYNMPLYKIPAGGHSPAPLPGEEPYTGRHLLYDVARDPQQLNPVTNAKLEQHYTARITHHLAACEAPREQYTRLGLTP